MTAEQMKQIIENKIAKMVELGYSKDEATKIIEAKLVNITNGKDDIRDIL